MSQLVTAFKYTPLVKKPSVSTANLHCVAKNKSLCSPGIETHPPSPCPARYTDWTKLWSKQNKQNSQDNFTAHLSTKFRQNQWSEFWDEASEWRPTEYLPTLFHWMNCCLVNFIYTDWIKTWEISTQLLNTSSMLALDLCWFPTEFL
jgi:hypothetical protein